MKYLCEECSKIYDTEDEVKKCELKHSEDKKIEFEKAAQREFRWKEVCEAKEKYQKLFKDCTNDYLQENKIHIPYKIPFNILNPDFLL